MKPERLPYTVSRSIRDGDMCAWSSRRMAKLVRCGRRTPKHLLAGAWTSGYPVTLHLPTGDVVRIVVPMGLVTYGAVLINSEAKP